MADFSDYIVYVDESGDHSLSSIDPQYPVFVLTFCIFHKETYIKRIIPAIQEFKFRYFGHNMVVLHEHAIRKSKDEFSILMQRDTRERFMADLNALVANAPFRIVASCIRKNEFKERRGEAENPYHVALEYGLERVFFFLQERKQQRSVTYLVFEQRGRKEDRELELEFRRICDDSKVDGLGTALRMLMVSKQSNASGLQLADLIARPIGRHLLQPDQPNRAFTILADKFRRSPQGKLDGWGLKCYP